MGLAVAAQDHLATLGISEGRAKEAIFDSFIGGSVSLAGKPAAFIAMSPQARVAMVNFALTTARTFAESADFKKRYADHREANGPDPLPAEQTVDEIFKKERANFEAQVEGMRKLFDQITPEQIATLEQGWKEMRDRFDDMQKGDRRKEIEDILKDQRAQQVKEHDEAMQALDKSFPDDPRALVAMRLRRFLDVSKDVAFDAKLVDSSSSNGAKKKVFADPDLEAKPAEWKLCFRAGKPATDAARAFAQKWLTDLQAQGVK
jgi:hypothetical protein